MSPSLRGELAEDSMETENAAAAAAAAFTASSQLKEAVLGREPASPLHAPAGWASSKEGPPAGSGRRVVPYGRESPGATPPLPVGGRPVVVKPSVLASGPLRTVGTSFSRTIPGKLDFISLSGFSVEPQLNVIMVRLS